MMGRASARCFRLSSRWAALVVMMLCGCEGPQSTLAPAGRSAEHLADLFWWMFAGATIIWLIVIGLFAYSLTWTEPHHPKKAAVYIIGGGAVIPTAVLAGLLAYGLAALPELMAPAPEGSLKIAVTGEQWWWRIRYLPPDGEPVDLANEIHLPVGEPVQFVLESADVIHSFWIPSLGGKMDMIPGRETRLALEPTQTGEFRGVCAEYCGGSHALMSFITVVETSSEFERWLAHQREPAAAPTTPVAERGRELFLANGCGACHTVRGTAANGMVGPDLTHVGSRRSLAAGVLPNDPEAFARWISRTHDVKPEVLMPEFSMLPPDDLRAISHYLDGLE